MNDFWTVFLTSNEPKYRLLRTILQGILGAIVANLDLLVSYLSIPTELKPFIVVVIMAILSPIMAELGESLKKTQKINELVAVTPVEPEGSWSDEYLTEEEIAEYRRMIIAETEGDDGDV